MKRAIKNYEGRYEISSIGRVKSVGRGRGMRPGRILALRAHEGGYLAVDLWANNKPKRFLVHRLVAAAFVGELPDNMEVNHDNGNKKDNRASNLEIVSRQENIDHAVATGLINNKGTRNSSARITEDDVLAIRREYKRGVCGYLSTSRKLGLSQEIVRGVITGRTWSHFKNVAA